MAWLLSLTAIAAVIVVNHQLNSKIDTNYTSFAHGLYDTLSRVIWAIAMCYIIFACVHDSSGPIDWFLSHRFWQPMARLSFAIYMVHRPIPLLMVGTMKTIIFLSEPVFFFNILINCILSIAVAIIATLAFESPIINLEKIFFENRLKIKSPIIIDKQNIKSNE